jgi:hypothetical protein
MIDGDPLAWRVTFAAPAEVGRIILGAPVPVTAPCIPAWPAEVINGRAGAPLACLVTFAAPNDVGKIMLGAPLDGFVICATPAATGKIMLAPPVA